jgi:signal transduction histidine kinase
MIICNYITPDFFGIVSFTGIPKLLFYAYIPIMIVSSFLGFLIYKHDKKEYASFLLILSLSFSFWIILDILSWIIIDASLNLMVWMIALMAEIFIYILPIYFLYSFCFKKSIKKIYKTVLLLITGFFVVLSQSIYNYKHFDLDICEGVHGYFWDIIPLVKVICLMILVAVGLSAIFMEKNKIRRKMNSFVFIGSFVFLTIFSFSTSFSDITNIFEFNLIGPLGMVVFLSLLTFLIVRFKAFDIKLIGSQALVWALIVLVGSEFFFVENLVNQILVGVTLIISSVSGLLIVRSVKREITLREHLEIANRNQESLIHFVSHQLKGFFTKSKMIFSGIVEDDFGSASKELKDAAKEGLLSDDNAVAMIQDILGASNLKKGTTTYNMKEVDFADVVRKTCEGFKKEIEDRGLGFINNIPNTPIKVLADLTQITQVVKNLIDNSLKYTPKGSVEVSLSSEKKDGKDKVLLVIKDTGIGLSESDKNKLFTEGGKGDESLKVNVNSTGYGLYIVKKIVENHGGKIWAESDGRGMGSRFYVELGLTK